MPASDPFITAGPFSLLDIGGQRVVVILKQQAGRAERGMSCGPPTHHERAEILTAGA